MSNIRNYVFAGLSLFLATGWEGAGYQEKVYEMKCDRLGCFERKYKDGVLVEEDYHKAPAEGGPFETSERTIVRMHQDPNVADPNRIYTRVKALQEIELGFGRENKPKPGQYKG